MTEPKRIFSGDYSRDMWEAINSAETVEDMQDALYLVCCRLQELETLLDKKTRASLPAGNVEAPSPPQGIAPLPVARGAG